MPVYNAYSSCENVSLLGGDCVFPTAGELWLRQYHLSVHLCYYAERLKRGLETQDIRRG